MTMRPCDDWLRATDFCKNHSSIITLGSLRWILFNSSENGADYFVRRLGKKRLLISPSRFFEWLEKRDRRCDKI